MSHPPRLRVTERCLRDDLGLDVGNLLRDARAYCAEHHALRSFVAKREPAPSSGENMLRVKPVGHIKTLHSGRGRGVTLYDPELNVCWLLAFGETHAKGERRDVFNDIEKLSARGELLPTTADIERLDEVSSASLLDTFAEIGAGIYDEARATPNQEVNRSFKIEDGESASVLIIIDLMVIDGEKAEEGWVLFSFPPDLILGTEQILDLLNSMLPATVDLDSLIQVHRIGGRQLRYNELGFSWSCLPE